MNFRGTHFTLASVTILLISSASVSAEWAAVGTGIEYRQFSITGPNEVHVTRMDRSNMDAYIESSIGQGRTKGGTETVRNQAARYDDAIGYWNEEWGTRNQVVVAINGSSHNPSTGEPHGGMFHSGWYAKRYEEVSGQAGFAWHISRHASMGFCITHPYWQQQVTYPTPAWQPDIHQRFHGMNRPRGSDELVIYTPQYDTTTGTNSAGVEVLVQLWPETGLMKPRPHRYEGIIREIRQNAGSSPIPFDHVVWSATGSSATKMLEHAYVGRQVGVSQELWHYDAACETRIGLDWTKVYAGVGGNLAFLRNGVIQYGIDGSGGRHARTAIGFNDDYVYFLVVDGRQTHSIGMTIDELAEFFKNELNATWATNQDGGGSSTMVINGAVVNSPSDGWERAVANGMLMVNFAPKVVTSDLLVESIVQTHTASPLRLGPGTNYGFLMTVPADTEGVIIDHRFSGIYAKGDSWWYVDFDGTKGWLPKASLDVILAPHAAYITQHPTDQTIVLGTHATFSIQAEGTAPLSYRWHRNGTPIGDFPPYSGAASPTLLITNAIDAHAGNYHCVVTNNYGATPSDPATLAFFPIVSDFDHDGDVDLEDFGYLQSCLGIIDVQVTHPACAAADLDGNGDVGPGDVTLFRNCLSGPEIPAEEPCAL